MSGICGTTAAAGDRELRAMNSLMRHRGPDGEGIRLDLEHGVGIGARRLAVIDVEGGHQPLANEDEAVWAVLDGEIYNHPQLRTRLLEKGHKMRTRSDTEVLVHLYEEYGEQLVHAIEGMYAFAIWDRPRRRLLLGRDRFGEKPLFYALRGGNITFASELTALRGVLNPAPDLEPRAVAAFLALGCVPGPLTIFRSVNQLPPGHTLTWDGPDRRVRLQRYWSPALPRPSRLPHEDLVAEARHLLEASVRSRLVADVPAGIFLRGGLDSTLLAALASACVGKVRTFAVGYDTAGLIPARRSAEAIGTEHHELILTEADLRVRVPRILACLDQPLANQALVASNALAERARALVTVALGDEGAGELFGGNPRYRWLSRADGMGTAAPASAPSRLRRMRPWPPPGRRFSSLGRHVTPAAFIDRNGAWVATDRRALLPRLAGPALRPFPASDDLLRIPAWVNDSAGGLAGVAAVGMWLDQTSWLPDDVLARADRSSMQASLEARTPYLDRRLAEFANSLPATVLAGRSGRRLLKEVLRRVLPSAGWASGGSVSRQPAASWLRGPLAPALRAQLKSGSAFQEGWLDRRAVAGLANEHLAGEGDRSLALWPLLAFGLWLDCVRENEHA